MCCSVLQCVAVCCSVLQCVAVCCSVLQCGAECCSVLQCVTVRCSVLQCVASVSQCVAVCCKCVAVCCSVLQCVASVLQCNVLQALQTLILVCLAPFPHRCSMLQYVAVRCSMLQYVAACRSVSQCVLVCCSVLQCGVVCCIECCVHDGVWVISDSTRKNESVCMFERVTSHRKHATEKKRHGTHVNDVCVIMCIGVCDNVYWCVW